MPAAPAALLKRLSTTTVTDGECLRRYAHDRDEAAFAEVVRRNGPLVLRACRSVLADPAAADDAFQATFLALARHARRLTDVPSAAGWLYRVAVRSAGAVRRSDARRRRREQVAAAKPRPTADTSWGDVREAIDAALVRLPDVYRTPLLLCYVQGLTYDEAARRLSCSPGTLRGRLERGRALLRARLERLGLPVVAVLAVGVPAVDAGLRAATLAAVRAAGPTAAGRVVPGALAGGLVLVAAGVAIVAGAGPAADPPKPPADPPPAVAAPPAAQLVDVFGDPLPPGALARLGTARFRHDSNLDRVIVSADGKRIAAHGHTGYKLWEGDSGKPIPLCKELAGAAPDSWYTFAPVGDGLVAIASAKDRIRVIDPETGKESLNVLRTDQFNGLGLTPDGKSLVGVRTTFDGGRARSTVRVWAAGQDRWTDLGEVAAGGNEVRFGFSADSKVLAVRAGGGVTVWDLPARKSLLDLPANGQQFLEGFALSADGKLLAREDSATQKVRVYDVATGKELPELPDQPKRLGQTLAFSPDGKTLAAVDGPISIRLWDVATRKKLRDIRANDFQVFDLAFAAGGKRLVAADGNGVTVFDPATGKLVVDHGGHTYTVWAAAWSPDGKRLATGAAYTDNVARVWDAATGRKAFDLAGHVYGIEVTAYSPDGRLIATGSQDQTASLWDAATGKRLHTFAPKDGMVYALAFSPDGRHLVTGGKKNLHVWDVADRTEVRALPHVGSLPLKIEFHPDGRRLVVRDRDSGLRVVDFTTGKEVTRFGADKEANATALSPDGRLVATGDDAGAIKLWDIAVGREVRALTGSDAADRDKARVMGLAFGPDGRTLAATFGNGQVRVYELASGTERFRFAGHLDCGLRAVFAPDGRRLATTGADRTILIWDVAGGRAPAGPVPADVTAAWTNLLAGDAGTGFAAIRYLADHADAAVPLLADRLKPVAPTDAAAVAKWIEQLDSPKFAERERASKELAALGDAAAGPLRTAAARPGSAEARERLAPLVAALDTPTLSGERLRAARAVEALERIGTPAARKVLEALAGGAQGARLTTDAKESLGRLR